MGEVDQWGEAAVSKLTPQQIGQALRDGHLTAYLAGQDVDPSPGPQRPVQATAEEVAAMSPKERKQALDEGRLADYLATPNAVVPAGGAEL